MKGLHLVGDLTGCQCAPDRLRGGAEFETACTELVRSAGLDVVGLLVELADVLVGRVFAGAGLVDRREEQA